MNLTAQKLISGFSVASAVMALLFTGNWAAGQASAAYREPTVSQTVPSEETQPPTETVAATEQTEATEVTAPVDPRREALAQAAEEMDAGCVFVYDTALGEMLYCGTGAGERLYPASITKLFSAWVALKYVNPEKVVTAGDELGLVQPGSSTAYIKRGCRLTVEMLVEGMLLPSGNDASYVLAAAAGRAAAEDENLDGESAVAVFVEVMNREARQLGLKGSHFTNPDGYHDEDHFSTPEDMVRMAELALSQPVIARYAGLQQDTVVFTSGEWANWYNTNSLINPESPYYVASAAGLKTGYTSEAGYCLLAAFETDAGQIVIGIFDAATKHSRYTDAIALLEICE